MSDISCQLMGGLGNQLFQIFTTIAYGMKYNREVFFPYSETLEFGISRDTYWNSFLSSLKHMTTDNPNSTYSNDQLSIFTRYNENGHHYTEIPNLQNKRISLFGYFQSPLYFEKETQDIFALMNLSESKQKIRDEYPEYFTPGSTLISMHFRLGDYKTKQNHHPIMPCSYYDKSLNHILLNCKIYGPVNVLYFCEEEDNHIILPVIAKLSGTYSGFNFIKVDDTIEDWKQLLLMSNCHHNIIANSSFSWWGAYFNNNSDKIVCYPSLWFGPALMKNNVSDMTPHNWTKIDVR